MSQLTPSDDPSKVVARQGQNTNKIIQSSYQDLVPSRSKFSDSQLLRPSSEAIESETLQTQQVIDKLLQQRTQIKASGAGGLSVNRENGATYIRYKSKSIFNQNGQGDTMERIIKIVDKVNDPMLPAKFKVAKTPQRPPSPPAPVLHDAPKKLTLQEQKDWYIPPAISNWKNQKGFTILIDKRMSYLNDDKQVAGEGDSVNYENLSKLTDLLAKAEDDAREEIKLKNEMRLKLQEQELQEQELKLLRLVNERASDGRNAKGYESRDARLRDIAREERRRKAEREIKLSKLNEKQRFRAEAGLEVSDRVINNVVNRASGHEEPEFDSRLYQKAKSSSNNAVYDLLFDGLQDLSEVVYDRSNGDDIKRSDPVRFEKDEVVSLKNKRLHEEEEEGGLRKMSKSE